MLRERQEHKQHFWAPGPLPDSRAPAIFTDFPLLFGTTHHLSGTTLTAYSNQVHKYVCNVVLVLHQTLTKLTSRFENCLKPFPQYSHLDSQQKSTDVCSPPTSSQHLAYAGLVFIYICQHLCLKKSLQWWAQISGSKSLCKNHSV